MHVVSAGMHPAILTGKVNIGLLFNRKSIHITPNHENLSLLFASCQSNQAGFATFFWLIAHFRKFFFYKGKGFF